MADIYIINTETPKDIAVELQQLDPNNTYTVLKSHNTARAMLIELEELKKNKKLFFDEKKEIFRKISNLSKYYDSQKISNFKEFLFQKAFEPNKLTYQEIEDLCLEFYENFIASNSRRLKGYPEAPRVIITEDLYWWLNTDANSGSVGYKQIVDNLMKNIDKEIHAKYLWSFPFIDPLHINKSYGGLINRNNNFGGIIQYGRFNSRIYEINFNNAKLNSKNQRFWDWYQKSWDVIAMYYNKNTNTCHVIKKPDEWKIEDNDTKMYYRYGNREKFFFGNLEVPKWLYTTPAKDLKVEDYFLLMNNADIRTEFVKKIGIERLVDLGTVIDSYENYPDNEMWAKSEYKIIDMHEIIPPRQILDNFGYKRSIEKPFEYAPFLYMKNQTTGIYHLEGLHPRCKTLYDAIKMRYNGLNIKDYEIKDIK